MVYKRITLTVMAKENTFWPGSFDILQPISPPDAAANDDDDVDDKDDDNGDDDEGNSVQEIRFEVRTCLLLPGLACKTPFLAPFIGGFKVCQEKDFSFRMWLPRS